MNCIFCKQGSDTSRSIEHLIPESLGNKTATLPPGVVCDNCNNYFARKVEAPFIASPAVKNLRFLHALPNKRGRINPVQAVATPGGGLPITVTRYMSGPIAGDVVTHDGAFMTKLSEDPRRELLFGEDTPPLTGSRIVSRFVAKVALECMAYVALQNQLPPTWPLESDFDSLRAYARRNEGDDWPISVRRIHGNDALWHEMDGSLTRPGWMLAFEVFNAQHFADGSIHGEFHFVASFFGYEMAINLGGRFIDTYREWVWRHPGESVLLKHRDGHLVDRAGPKAWPFPSSRVLRIIYEPRP